MNLAQLIAAQKDGRTYAQLAKDCGGAPSDKRLQQLAKYPIKEFPDPGTLRALARGLRVGERVVVLAVAETLNLNVQTEGRLIDHLPSGTDRIAPDQVDALVRLVHTLVPATSERGEEHAGSAANTTGDQDGGALVVEFPDKTPKDVQSTAARSNKKRGPQGPRAPQDD